LANSALLTAAFTDAAIWRREDQGDKLARRSTDAVIWRRDRQRDCALADRRSSSWRNLGGNKQRCHENYPPCA